MILDFSARTGHNGLLCRAPRDTISAKESAVASCGLSSDLVRGHPAQSASKMVDSSSTDWLESKWIEYVIVPQHNPTYVSLIENENWSDCVWIDTHD